MLSVFWLQIADNLVSNIPVAVIASDRPHYLYRYGCMPHILWQCIINMFLHSNDTSSALQNWSHWLQVTKCLNSSIKSFKLPKCTIFPNPLHSVSFIVHSLMSVTFVCIQNASFTALRPWSQPWYGHRLHRWLLWGGFQHNLWLETIETYIVTVQYFHCWTCCKFSSLRKISMEERKKKCITVCALNVVAENNREGCRGKIKQVHLSVTLWCCFAFWAGLSHLDLRHKCKFFAQNTNCVVKYVSWAVISEVQHITALAHRDHWRWRVSLAYGTSSTRPLGWRTHA